MKYNQTTTKLSGLLCATLALSSCRDIVVKVQKKPKDANLSSVQSTNNSLSLTGAQDFLGQLDSLKGSAADFVVKQLAQDNYIDKVRTSVRKYRHFMISKATTKMTMTDSFYSGSDQCRHVKLSFNMHDADDFLGVILQTVVLAKIGEVSAGHLSSGLAQQISAISKLILLNMGIDVQGNVDVTSVDGLTTTTGSVTVALTPIPGEKIDAATLEADKDEVLTMIFSRVLGEKNTGTFEAAIDISHRNDAGATENLEGRFAISRVQQDSHFDNDLKFSLGVKGSPANYSRDLDFKQVRGSDHKIQVIDTFHPDAVDQIAYPTIIDLRAFTQCKGTAPEGTTTGGQGATSPPGNNEPTPIGDSNGSGTPNGSGTGTTNGSGTGTTNGSGTGTTNGSGTGTTNGSGTGTTNGSGTGTTNGSGTTATGGKGSDADKPSTTGGTSPSQTPGQTPAQTPAQTPTQTPAVKV